MAKPVTTAAKPETETVRVEAKQNVVALNRSGENLPDFIRDDLKDYAGAGVSDRREDNLVPFLYVAQALSPQANKRDASYIEGLEPGMIFDTSTRQIWNAESPDGGPVLIQAHFEPCEVEWGLRNTPEKGYKGKHPADTDLLREIREVPKESGRGVLRLLPNGHQLVTTRIHYMILADELRPVAISLSSSGLQPSRALNTMLRNKKIRRDGRLVVAPSFATLLRMRTVFRQDGEYSWFVPVFEDLGFITDARYLDAYEEGKLLHQSAMAGEVKTAAPPEESDVRAGNPNQDGRDPDADPADDSPL